MYTKTARTRQRLAFAWCLSRRAGRDSPAHHALSPDLVAYILQCVVQCVIRVAKVPRMTLTIYADMNEPSVKFAGAVPGPGAANHPSACYGLPWMSSRLRCGAGKLIWTKVYGHMLTNPTDTVIPGERVRACLLLLDVAKRLIIHSYSFARFIDHRLPNTVSPSGYSCAP